MDIIERERDFLSTTNLDWSKTDNDILANYTVKCCGALCDYVLHNLYRNMNNIAHDNMKKKKYGLLASSTATQWIKNVNV